MKLINRDTDCAVQAILYIARSHKEVVDTALIENELSLPRPFLRKILQRLRKQGILESVRGNHGGFRLRQTIDKIFLSDVIRIFQGKLTFTECLFRKQVCRNVHDCSIRRKLEEIEQSFLRKIMTVTIAELMEA